MYEYMKHTCQNKIIFIFIPVIFFFSYPQYSLAYAFLKLVNYSFFFWLPFYLNNAFGWKESVADNLSTAYDIAGIFGMFQNDLIYR